MSKVIYKKISLGEEIPYTRLHPKYGWGEFLFCIKRDAKGIIQRIFITRNQQGDGLQNDYVIDLRKKKLTTLYFSGQNASNPEITDAYWCLDHKTEAVSIHSPRLIDNGYIKFDIGLGLVWANFKNKDR